MALDSQRWVQPLLIQRGATHEDAIAAVVAACVQAYLARPDNTGWLPWLSSSFAKSVRRARPADMDATRGLALSDVTFRTAHALGFAPMQYADMPKTLSRTQVTGTDFPRDGWPTPAHDHPDRPTVVIDDDLHLSTGKAAAQAAHGLLAWYLQSPVITQQAWIYAQSPFTVTGMSRSKFRDATRAAAVTITDSGFTEIAPNTCTVLVLQPNSAEVPRRDLSEERSIAGCTAPSSPHP